MNQFIQLLGETFTVLCCGEDWHPRIGEEFTCPKCGKVWVWEGRKSMSALEDEFAYQLDLSGIAYMREYQAIPERKFRWDFRLSDNLLVELNGGTWQHMGHSTGTGIQRDCEKHNLAILAGWRVLMFTADDVKSGRALTTTMQALGWE